MAFWHVIEVTQSQKELPNKVWAETFKSLLNCVSQHLQISANEHFDTENRVETFKYKTFCNLNLITAV